METGALEQVIGDGLGGQEGALEVQVLGPHAQLVEAVRVLLPALGHLGASSGASSPMPSARAPLRRSMDGRSYQTCSLKAA